MRFSSLLLLAVLVGLSSASGIVNFLKSGIISEKDVVASLNSELAVVQDGLAGERLAKIQEGLRTMFKAMPKNSEGKLNHQAVRYALHRFLVHRYGWFIRGMEPNNDTWHGAADPNIHNSTAMKEWVPSYLQDILEQKLKHDGTDLKQLSALAATLEDVIRKEARGRLESAFDMFGFPRSALLTRAEVESMMTTYYVAFLNSGDFSAFSREEAERNTRDFISDYANWPAAYMWLEELMSKYLKAGPGGKFNFESLASVAMKMGEEYFSFNDKECEDLKQTLRGMQGKKPGRVRLSTFYNKGMYSHWDFMEKKEYLRSLGALDESSPEHPFVLIANYAMARPNCLDSSNVYTICCRNECEDLLGTLEAKFGGDMAKPGDIASVIKTLPSASVESPRSLSTVLLDRLDEIASGHEGMVPLHGRLFAQWMHNAYPLECPYPHEMGTVNPLTASEWVKETGQQSVKASTEEMMEHIAADTCSVGPEGRVKCSEETADIPWSSNEELLTWHPRERIENSKPGVSHHHCWGLAVVCALIAGSVSVGVCHFRKQSGKVGDVESGFTERNNKVARQPALVLGMLSLAAYTVGLLDGYLYLCITVCGSVMLVAEQVTSRWGKAASPKAV